MPKKNSASENPALDSTAVDRLERSLLSLLKLRIDGNESEFEEAKTAGRWSHVAGLHGIGTGLIIAQKLVQEEFEALRRQAVTKPGKPPCGTADTETKKARARPAAKPAARKPTRTRATA